MAKRPEQTSGVLGLNSNLNKKVNPNLPTDDMWELDGFYPTEALSLTKRKGFATYNNTSLTESGTPVTFNGLFEYVPAGASVAGPIYRHQIACTTSRLYRFNSGTSEWEELSMANVGGNRSNTDLNLYDAATLEDQMYLGNGVDTNIHYDGTHPTRVATRTQCFQMGIDAPVIAHNTPPSVITGTPTGANGNLAAGDYQYIVTYGDRLGNESNPGCASAVITVAPTQRVDLTNIPISPDPQVTARHLYRTAVDGAIYLFLDTIPDNTTQIYSDTHSDEDLQEEIEMFANGVPPKFSMIDIFRGIAFMAGDPDHPSRLWFSGPGLPNSVDSNDFRDLDPNDGSVITGIRRFQNTIVVTKGNSIWNLTGEDRFTFALERRVTAAGSINNASIVEVPTKNQMIMLNNYPRFFVYDGVTAQPTAANIEPILKTLNQVKLSKAVGTVVPSQNQCRWIVPSGGNDDCDLMIWYDYVQDKWGTTSLANVPANYCTTMRNLTTDIIEFYLCARRNMGQNTGGGKVWRGDSGGTDDGANIAVQVTDRGHPVNSPSPENQKTFDTIIVWYQHAPGTQATILDVYVIKDDPDDGTPHFIGQVQCDQPSGQHHIHMNETCRRLYVQIRESSSAQGLVLRGWKLVYKDIGRWHAP